jgi:glutathione S-transferase
MITVHGRPNSSNVAKVMWTLSELNVDHERVDLGGPFGGNKEPAYLAMNPNGLIPLLVDGPARIWESNAIVRYLGAAYGAGSFWAVDPAERALADRWMDWGTIYLYPKIIALMKAGSPEELDLAIADTAGPCGILNEALSASRFLAGDALTIGDISVGVHLGRLFRFADGRLSHPNLKRYFDELSARPAFVRNCLEALR